MISYTVSMSSAYISCIVHHKISPNISCQDHIFNVKPVFTQHWLEQ